MNVTFSQNRSRYGLEIAFILACLLLFTRPLQDFSPGERIRGKEFSYLVNSATIAANIYEETGSIPLWNPLIGRGEPLIESPFSFVLNPLMTLPIFWWGAVQGAKVGFLLHIALMGIGGWTFGYALGLRAPGRLLLGLLLGGSGSMAGAVSLGFYQMGCSQAYVPWVYASLIRVLYPGGIVRDLPAPNIRRWVGLLAVFSALMIFAGTFWYVLPTAIGCAVVTGFALWRRRIVPPIPHQEGRGELRDISPSPIKREGLGVGAKPGSTARPYNPVVIIGVALLFTVGLAAIRLLPQAVHLNLIEHPGEYLDKGILDFWTMFRLLFIAYPPAEFPITAIHYHYTLPPWFVVFLLVGCGVLWWRGRKGVAVGGHGGAPLQTVSEVWRIVIPALLLVFLFVTWAQEATPLFVLLYDVFPTLREWRLLGRMLAAASPWLVVLAALVFDTLVFAVGTDAMDRVPMNDAEFTGRGMARLAPTLQDEHRRGDAASLIGRPYTRRSVRIGLLVITLIVGLAAAFNVLENWRRITGVERNLRFTGPLIYYLRASQPQDFLSVMTWESFDDYLPLYDVRARATFGNPDYRPGSIEPTFGTWEMMQYYPEYVIASWDIPASVLPDSYELVIDTAGEYTSTLWYSPAAPTYAYRIFPRNLSNRTFPIDRRDIRPVTTFNHHFERVNVRLDEYEDGELLVITETAYPGWQVRVNGEAAELESVGGLLGVRLPQDSVSLPLRIEFVYVPVWLYIGGGITLLTAVGLALVLLRVDGWVRR